MKTNAFEKTCNAHYDIDGHELLEIVNALNDGAIISEQEGYSEQAQKRLEIAKRLFGEFTWLLRANKIEE